jgi:hypothetical protein
MGADAIAGSVRGCRAACHAVTATTAAKVAAATTRTPVLKLCSTSIPLTADPGVKERHTKSGAKVNRRSFGCHHPEMAERRNFV